MTIQTDLARKQFSGAGSILLKVAAPTLTTLTFNAHPTLSLHNFSLTSSALKTDSTQQIDASAISRDDKMERVTITLDKALGLKEGDEFRLNLGWKAALGTSMTVRRARRSGRRRDADVSFVPGLLRFELHFQGVGSRGVLRSHSV